MATVSEPPLLIAVYVSCGDLHTLLKSEGGISGSGLSPSFVASLTEAAAEAATTPGSLASKNGQQPFVCTDLSALASQYKIAPGDSPRDIHLVVVAPIFVPANEGRGRLVIGSAIVCHASTRIRAQAAVIVRSLAKTTAALLEKNFSAMRRMKEQHQQEQIVHLMRMTQGEFGFLPSIDSASDRDQIAESGHADLESTFFQQAVNAARDVLDADAVVIFDVSGFRLEETARISRRGRHKRHLSSERNHFSVEGMSSADTSAKTTSAANARGREDESGAGLKSRSKIGDFESHDFESNPSSSTDMSSRESPSIVCSFASSDKSVPLLASSGRASHHWRDLPGRTTRSAFASLLANSKASGSVGRSQGQGQDISPSGALKVFASTSSLMEILPESWRSLLAAPVFETTGQPCYLLLAAYKRRPTYFESSDCLFLETIGAVLLSSALRIRSQAIDRAQIQLTSRMQHQLRTPLHTIVGICKSAGDLLNESENNRRIIASIALSAEALDSTISDVFDYSVLAGIKEPHIASPDMWPSVNLRGLFSLVSRTAISAWRLHCLSLSWLQEDEMQVLPPPELVCTSFPSSWANSPETFTFDCEALTRITSKIVTNALQATQEGRIAVNLALKPSKTQSSPRGVGEICDLHLTVTDTGKGMDEDFLRNQVFRPFSLPRDDASEAGLSLSICSSLMLRLGGRIHISSRENKVSILDFAFPCRGTAPNPEWTDTPQSRNVTG